ncbi:MAG: hypothetical protein LBO04_07370 [Spirochaetaceae bacterium]|jgi:hypothetical protein|nr:hypothetical protein [Spirochaetaceae bacterium]
MKVNPVLLVIAAAIVALAAFGFFTGNENETYRWLITTGSALSFFATLGGLLAFQSGGGGTSVNIKVVSALFFIVLLIEHLVFSFTVIRLTPYVIITGLLLLVYVLICYVLTQALKKQ